MFKLVGFNRFKLLLSLSDPLLSLPFSALSSLNNIKLVHWPLMGWLLHLVQRGGDWAEPQPAQAPPVLLYRPNGPLLCGFNVPIKGLR